MQATEKKQQRQSRKFKGIRCWFSANQLKVILKGYYGRNLTNEELTELFKDLGEERVVSMIEESFLELLLVRMSGTPLSRKELVITPQAKVISIVEQEPEPKQEESNVFGEIDFDAALDEIDD